MRLRIRRVRKNDLNEPGLHFQGHLVPARQNRRREQQHRRISLHRVEVTQGDFIVIESTTIDEGIPRCNREVTCFDR